MPLLKLDWDEAKNAVSIEKHGIDFNDVCELFEQPLLRGRDDRRDYGEDRWIGVGTIGAAGGCGIHRARAGHHPADLGAQGKQARGQTL